jgi:hypothetical protein
MIANQAKTDADVRDMRGEMMARLETEIESDKEKLEVLGGNLVSRMDINQARTESTQEDIKAKMDSYQEKSMMLMKASKEEVEAMREACLEKMEASPEERVSESEHEEVPKEEAIVENFGALKELHGDQHLAIRRCGQPNKWTQGSGESRKKLVTAQGRLTCRAIPAFCKGHYCPGQGCAKNPERTDFQGETSGATRMQQWHKGPRHNPTAMAEEGDEN